MKICFLTSGHEVFDSRIYYKEILSLKKKYDEIYIIAPGEKSFTTKDGIKVLSFEKRKKWYDRFRPMKEIFQLALSVNADIYHAHEPDSFQVAVKLKKCLGAKIIFDSHEYHPESFAEHFKFGRTLIKKCVYLYERHLGKKADYIISVNDLLVNKFKKYNRNVALFPNYPVITEIEPEEQFSEIPTFVYVGGISKERGIIKILESIKLVKGKYRYVIIGHFSSEDFKNEVYKYVEENLKDQEIVFTGTIPHIQVSKYLRNACGGFVLLQPTSWRYVNSEPRLLEIYKILGSS
jgi:glycosyltransferase involved in cell wall biosynthesis